ncbi:hypothetical protein Nepgr_015795 [Nepenthes gracilis]|uniref:Uncharacterized protein n=1 Tax=Nepenthes gracilis TaxID=150966 RepID=A0AAD3SNE7_NEPGR|nr:hypothetical protein Nepgr_015793 [Nepenthes gracilis]GMH13954.1 hypothetical protein Nepgr_015795 [Nepenthes gracilis]
MKSTPYYRMMDNQYCICSKHSKRKQYHSPASKPKAYSTNGSSIPADEINPWKQKKRPSTQLHTQKGQHQNQRPQAFSITAPSPKPIKRD